MGLFQFVKDAGEKLLHFGKDNKPEVEPAKDPGQTAEALSSLVGNMGFEVSDLRVGFAGGRATIYGEAASQEVREKVVLLIGNTNGVAEVEVLMTVANRPETVMYTVVSGDSLSKISKEHYGDAMKYNLIFEANRPMLSHPDKIYPGQVLRIPPLDQMA